MGFPQNHPSHQTAGAMHAALLAAEPTVHAREGSPAGASHTGLRQTYVIHTQIYTVR